MKTRFFENWKGMLVLAALPVLAAGLQPSPAAPDAATAGFSDGEVVSMPADQITNTVSTNAPIAAETNIMQGLLKPSTPTLPDLNLTPVTTEMVRLAQAGTSESVMLAYITNTTARFALGSDEVIYLNDIGLSGTVVTAMLQHDTALDAAAAANVAVTMPTNQMDVVPEQPTTDMPATIPPDYAETPPPGGDYGTGQDVGYFYDSMAPYGSWVYVGGYGLCWQPTVCVRNPGWRPYLDCGRWVYSDCGWYWNSDYSWGWAPFHYGRWFCDSHAGWVWHPDHTWGPSWVSWRSTSDHVGWAPLPPAAHFSFGVGLTFQHHAVTTGFGFGLNAGQYAFIPTARMTDLSPSRYVVGGAQATRVFNDSTVLNHVTVENHKVFNGGIRPDVVETAAHVPVRRATIQETTAGSTGHVLADHIDKHGNNMTIFRPSLSSVNPARGNRGNNPKGFSPRDAATAAPVSARGTSIGVGATAPPSSTLRLPPVAGTPTSAVPTPSPVSPARTVSSSATPGVNERRPRVEVYKRPEDVTPGKPAQVVQVPRFSVSGSTVASVPQAETYPPNSIVLRGPQSSSTASARSPQEVYHADTSYHFQVPRSQIDPQPVQAYSPPANNSGSIFSGRPSNPNQSFGRSMPESQPASPQGQGNGGFNRGFGNSPNVATSPRATFSPAQPQAPILLPSRAAYSAPASQPAPSFTPRSQNFAPSPSRQEIQLPPQQHYSAPAPAPAAAPAQSSSHSSSGASSSPSSSSGGGRR